MKANPLFRIFLIIAMSFAFARILSAQAVKPVSDPDGNIPPPAPVRVVTTPANADDDIVELSPFTVISEKERGYMAKETLAGMRIRTDLKDVGAAIDVLTDNFLNDVGATDLDDAIKYVANMRYADYPSDSDSSNNTQWFSYTYLSRGVPGSSVLVDFFKTGAVPIDRYNTENMTFMRGPNSILFGIGSPSGVIGSSGKRARMASNTREIRFAFDLYESARTEFDISQMIIKNRLAVRVAGVMGDKHTMQAPSLNRRNALYGTITYKPTKRTNITVNIERGFYERLFALNQLVSDAYTPWVNAGRPTTNFVTGHNMTSGYATDRSKYSTALNSGLQSLSAMTAAYLVYVEGSGLPIMDWRGMPRGARHENDIAKADNYTPGVMYTEDRTQLNNTPFTAENTIVDLDANIWGGNNTNDLDYSRQAIFVEQNLARGLDLELAANRFETEYLFNFFGANSYIYVDPSEVLPDGTPNPYVGMPYIETSNGENDYRRIRDRSAYTDFRMTLSYELNLEHLKIFKNLGLGNYRFAGLYQDSRKTQQYVTSRFVNVTPLPNAGDTSLASQRNRIIRRYYLKPGESIFRFDGNLTPSQATTRGAPAGMDGPIRVEERNTSESPRNVITDVESFAIAVQAAWWYSEAGWPRITALYGMRHDAQRDRRQSYERNAAGEFPTAPGSFDNIEAYGTWDPETNYNVNTTSYNITVRPFSPVRFFYNYSDIFQPPESAVNSDVFGNPLRPARGETVDYGVKFDLFRERIFVTATKYKTKYEDRPMDNSGNLRAPINNIYEAINRNDLTLTRPYSYRNEDTEGYEFSVNGTIAKGWNLRIAVGKQTTTVRSAFEGWPEYFEMYRPLWEANSFIALTNPSGGYTTVADAISRADKRLNDARAAIGQRPTDQREWNVNVNTSYTIPSGALKGIRIGAGARWLSANMLGYVRKGFDEPTTPGAQFDFSRPFYGSESFNVDFSLGYSRRLLKNKLTWDIQINFTNIFDDDDRLPRRAVDDGYGNPVYTSWYAVQPFGMQVTNTFKF